MTPSRLLRVVLLSGLACLMVVPLALREEAPPPADRAPASDRAASHRAAALAVLRDWDRARAAAWRRTDLEALARLYTAGSPAGRADRALLAAYARRGLRVTGMRMQVADVAVRSASRDRIELVVTDRLVGATAVVGGARLGLPRDRWSRREMVLVRAGEAWRVGEIRDQVSMVASTDSTSGSSNS